MTLAVSQLEQEVGATLITRMTRRPVFTHEGLALLTNARRIADEWDATLTSLKEDGPLTGPMRVTSTNDFGRVQLRPALDRIQALHPGIHRRLLLSDSTVNLIDEHIDLALRNGSLADSGLHALGIRTLLGSVRHDQWSGSYKPLRNCITFVATTGEGVVIPNSKDMIRCYAQSNIVSGHLRISTRNVTNRDPTNVIVERIADGCSKAPPDAI